MSVWTREWPTTAGYYWFHGHKWSTSPRDAEPTSTYFVRCCLDGTNSPTYITDGHFLYKAEGACGVWMPAKVPEPHDVTEEA